MSTSQSTGKVRVPTDPRVGMKVINGQAIPAHQTWRSPVSAIEQRQVDYQMELEEAGMQFEDESGVVRNPLHQASVVIVVESYAGMRLAFRELDGKTHRLTAVRVIVPGQLDSVASMADWITSLGRIRDRRRKLDALVGDRDEYGKVKSRRPRNAAGHYS